MPGGALVAGLDAGTGFDREIVVKVNVGEVLAREVVRPTWTREHVALGTNTDPYQRAEGRYALMPRIIKALAGSGTPFSILTKGTLLRRDIPLLQQAASDVPIGLGVSLAIYDDELHAALEPGRRTHEHASSWYVRCGTPTSPAGSCWRRSCPG